MSATILEVRGLSKAFGGLQVSRDIHLDVRAGEIHALIGPNGAGKTTLIDQIAGETRPDAGEILLDGRAVTGMSTARRVRLGLVRSYQVVRLFDDLSVMDNLMLAAAGRAGFISCLPRPTFSCRAYRERADAALAKHDLTEVAALSAAALSHGQRRLLELAMVSLMAPRVLLLDEPLAGLGPEQRQAMRGRIAALREQTAILLVEHDMDAVFALADRISVLVNGAIIASGDPQSIRTNVEVQKAYLGHG
ncbi:ABC transporter ATP-binding protein [Thermopetrobacter sp. TC1]|uniref:ABC transporter ATP-binding protein n=1 Tax=Thermopetrobacter sp. TC1 TaxID=1495045 RepID=UPI000571B99B|nr:ABC transporter ATP-binding protein [Thermopetrobacter sp. TC1]